jgi:predicted secreted hydrolase
MTPPRTWLALALVLMACSPALRGPPPAPLSFPADHGVHPEAQTEWWYLQGVLHDEAGRQLSLFVSSVLHDPRRDRVLGLPVLSWGSRIALLTASMADLSTGAVLSERRTLGVLPGIRQRLEVQDEAFLLRVRRWRTWGHGDGFSWEVPVDGGHLRLRVEPGGPPLAVMEVGQSAAAGRLALGSAAFSYYALPRVRLEGTLQRGGEAQRVEGIGWLDHQWGFVYAHEYGGWSWLALTLEDGTDLLLSRVEPRSAGTPAALVGVIREPGAPERALDEFVIEVPEGAMVDASGDYPLQLELRSRSEDLSLTVRSRLTEAEWAMVPVPIWEAPVVVEGSLRGRPVRGVGFYELMMRGDPPARRLYDSGAWGRGGS